MAADMESPAGVGAPDGAGSALILAGIVEAPNYTIPAVLS